MITTNRNLFIGAHITPAVDKALREEVERQRHTGGPASISEYVYMLLKNDLAQKGYETDEKIA